MHGNFNTMLNRKQHDSTVDARGWLIWEADDVSASITVTVIQNTITAAGEPIECSPDDETWKVDVASGNGAFMQGSASGNARAIVTKTDGAKVEQYWESPPLSLH
jgi:hypothetical protein